MQQTFSRQSHDFPFPEHSKQQPLSDGLYIVHSEDCERYGDALLQSFRLRHRVFVEEHNWKALARNDKLEIDQFDEESAIHIMIASNGSVVGYSRLLPTTGPHLLSDVYPELSTKQIPRGQDIYEWTRYCVSPEKRGGTAIGNLGSRLLFAVLDYALSEGITQLTMQTNPLWITRFFDLGFKVEPLGLPIDFDGEPVVAISIKMTENAVGKCRRLLRLRPAMGKDGMPLETTYKHATR